MIDIFAIMNKTRYKNVIFDLDGTLSDSKEGIINSLKYSSEKMGIKPPSEEKLISFIGIPLQEVFSTFFSFYNADLEQAVKYFREYYKEKGIFENTLFQGADHLIRDLSENSSLFIATSKLEKFAIVVLQHFGLFSYFKGICGADAEGINAEKSILLKKTMNTFHIDKGSSSVMIGDTIMDIDAAKKCGIHSIGVTYGYGNEQKITELKPDFVADSIEKLRGILFLN